MVKHYHGTITKHAKRARRLLVSELPYLDYAIMIGSRAVVISIPDEMVDGVIYVDAPLKPGSNSPEARETSPQCPECCTNKEEFADAMASVNPAGP